MGDYRLVRRGFIWYWNIAYRGQVVKGQAWSRGRAHEQIRDACETLDRLQPRARTGTDG